MTIQQIEQLAKNHFGITASAELLACEFGGNFKLTDSSGDSFLLKLSHPGQSRTSLEAENKMMFHLFGKQSGLLLPIPLNSIRDEYIVELENCYARLLTWIPGRLWADVHPKSASLLGSLGSTLGSMSRDLQDFDHPASHFQFEWDPWQVEWIEQQIEIFNGKQLKTANYFLELFRSQAKNTKGALRKGMNYNDANDYNIIVSEDLSQPVVAGFIDFGDIHYGPVINELAICLAYAMMGKEDPVGAACMVITAYHNIFPLQTNELDVLYPLIASRLLISVTKSALRKEKDPSNIYWQISERPAWELLSQLKEYSPHLALCRFRHACNLEPSTKAAILRSWLIENKRNISPVLGYDLSASDVLVFDWSVGSVELGNFDSFDRVDKHSKLVFERMAEKEVSVGIGRYNEARPVYLTDAYAMPGENGPEMRTIHIGIDLFVVPGSPVFCPFDGKVYSIVNNAGDKEYGPLVILEHHPPGTDSFYTLYGHNSLGTLGMLKEGQQVKKGMQIAEVGNFPENGNWVPHLHFQVISDMLGYKDDFPGVANPDQREVWLSLCPDPNLILGIEDPDLQVQELLPQDILHKRQELLGPNLSVSYKKPLKIVRGWKQYLFDHEARKYLDTVNNIAHVGHEHPFVVHAGQRQMGILNTNTRYLHENVISFSEQLLSTMPSQLEVVYFVNSGSEANELALRMSRWYTGTQETLVLDQGYHGNTQACIDVSSYKFDGPGGQGAGQGIHKLDVPDPLSPKSTGMAIDSIINQARDLIEGIQDEGTLRLNFIHETILSCAGQIVPPMNYFKSIYEIIRKTGGVCIADEVQTGLGRVGEKFWAFELFDIVPDIVTIGKPLGNGHPVAAVVTTREIADSFNNGMEFFSSFGGNPVSCAVGMAVLQVVKEEQLQHHALTVGNYLKRNLESLKKEFPIIGDVRGFGLFTGFELIKNHTQESRMVPATKETAYLINRMRQHKILMSSDGPHHNVIKIKPPMCIMKTDMDQITEILRKVLQEDLLMHVF